MLIPAGSCSPSALRGCPVAPPVPAQNGGICHPSSSSTCVCPHGWMGEICSVPCPPGRFGPGCQGGCGCHNGGHGDPHGGQCQCSPGFTGEQCQERCPAGRYGQDCRQSCDCANGGQCFHVDGGCLCEAGFRGSRCEERHCGPGLYGLHCESRCLCHPQHSLRYCSQRILDEHCSSLCPPNTFGVNCSGLCSCQHSLACSPLDGSCFCKEGAPGGGPGHCPPGWQGPQCLQPCPNGTFGAGCGQRCVCAHADGCDPVTGECHCLPGWTVWSCWITLWLTGPSMELLDHLVADWSQYGAVGPPCGPSMELLDHLMADWSHMGLLDPPQYGAIVPPSSPSMDLYSSAVSPACAPGTFGLQCEQLCHCPHNATCDPTNGTCPCTPGTTGPRCQAEHPDVPYTIEPAPPAASSPLGMVLSLVALVALLVAVVVTALCYHRWHKDKERRHLAVAYRAGQTDTSDYMVPDVPPSHHAHYYSNPSYHTLSQCPLPAPGAQDRASSSLKAPGTQLFPGVERPYSPEGNATLPPDWKHLGASAMGTRGRQLDRSYTYSHGLRKGESKEHPWEGLRASASSLASENPYATIKELPPAPAKAHEGSYMEMKSPVQREMSYAEIGLLEEPPQQESCPEGPEGSFRVWASFDDVPPARHYPPSPPLRRKDR
ncbi:platelet endothelial aggregation receptor 1 [Geospiza fortis]|uniref:Platelet endothelial aggregation receptor 1 n=1 Tax=Geospiza fortis TaxID=48883 RepID=A0A8N5EZF7_GEOFO|nr:platelet endothelial aggregation receptor 1 [Geospiza fortis]